MRKAPDFKPNLQESQVLVHVRNSVANVLGKVSYPYYPTLGAISTWLESRQYPYGRRKTLIHSLDKYTVDGVLDWRSALLRSQIKAFIKDEPYPAGERKPPRLICSREDPAKMVLGPLFQPLDDKLFNSRWSVKHMRPAEKRDALIRRFGDGEVLVLDYTSYECSQTRALRACIEDCIYRQCLSFDTNRDFVNFAIKTLDRDCKIRWGNNALIYKGPSIRFSGEVTTSLGNTLNNLVCILAAYRLAAIDIGYGLVEMHDLLQIPLVVEGDDSVTKMPFQDHTKNVAFATRMVSYL